ncbi:FAD-dependent oxidoreductase [Sphingopyxis sp.]|uniref:NAD(P)/FAD-dependent oxidoreductase n=1 Tax=Sphingopyxis sp. TaxID=1908224 RepID=UPI003458FF7F
MSNQSALPRIVILGAGLGGTIAAFEIMEAVQGKAHVSVISDSERFSFLLSNPWVAIGWRTSDAVQVKLSPVFEKQKIAFTTPSGKRLHSAENRVKLNDGQSVAYDYLVIATGSDLAFDEITGLGLDGGYTVSVCKTAHAEDTAKAFESFCKDPGPIIVGAAPGASCFGPVYEFVMILDTELRRREIRDRVPITLVTPEPYVGRLGLDGVGDTKSVLESELRERHIKWTTNAKTTSVEPNMLHADEIGPDGAVCKTHDVPFKYAMMLPAFRGIPAIFGIEGLTSPRGFVLVDEYQRSKTFPNIFALGVCVAIPPTGPTPVPVGVPKTCFMIESMATAIAHNLESLVNG